MTEPMRAAVALGGNLGDVEATFNAAIARMAQLPGTTMLARSSHYRTPPWGGIDQPAYLNAAVLLATTMAPQPLMQALLQIERALGRDRDNEIRWGPRRIDLDLLLVEQTTLNEPGLQLPHPRLQERAFALVPLLEVWPDAWIPGHGAASAALRALETADPAAVGSVIAGRLG